MTSRLLFPAALLTFFAFSACQSGKPEEKGKEKEFQVFTLIDTAESGLNFVNHLEEYPDNNIFIFDYYYNGGGVAIGDINNDGLSDVLLMGNTTGNRLYLNKGDLKFEDITEKSGLRQDRWSHGAVMADINGDGLLDIYICNGGPSTNFEDLKNEFYINQGDGVFEEQAEAYGIAGKHRSTQASFFDYDLDGDLDLYVMNYADLVFKVHDINKFETQYEFGKYPLNSSVLYRNEGNGSFTDVSKEAGIQKPGFGLGLITSDLNGDGLVDIYVSNDYLIPNFMFINNGDGTFTDRIKDHLDHCSYFSMGADYADFNNDGLQDIAEVDMMPDDHVRNKIHMRPMDFDLFFEATTIAGLIPQYMFNSFHVQHGFGKYSDIGLMAGVGKTDWSWATLLADWDNDGWKDYLITNGYYKNLKHNDFTNAYIPKISDWIVNEQFDSVYAVLMDYPRYPLVNYMFRNNRDLTFKNVSLEWGLEVPTTSSGAAYGDLDLDGDLDLVIANVGEPTFLYRNNSSEQTGHHWIRFRIVDSGSSRIPFNTKVEITRPNGEILLDELKTVRGYQSAQEPTLHFGLGADPAISSIRVIWPDGSVSRLSNFAIDQIQTIDRSQVAASREPLVAPPDFAFRDLSQTLFNKGFKHQENAYHDFTTEILLPYRHSTLGPMLTVGDINGDGWKDFYIGGAKGQSGQLYIMDPSRGFYQSECQPWTQHAASEDMGGAFFDADGDGDLDLYVASGGGGEFSQGAPELQDRVYLNDGKGCFYYPIISIVPEIRASSGRVAASDWDGDGDTDLFVAGRTSPGKYPFPGESVLLQNDKGKLTDVTDQLLPGLRNMGMITGAIFTDLNNDKKPDLILSGEWMTLKVFIQEGNGFADRTEAWGLADKTGWWHSIALLDVDQDGDQDLIAGNIGLNNKYKIKDSNPIHVYANDFDNTGTIDIVLSTAYKGNLVPSRGRQCSSDQMPFIKEKFPTYTQFANATLEDVYGKEKLNEALHYEVNEAHSMVWINNGKSFEGIPLPNAAQIGPILSIQSIDANRDSYPDLLIGGDLADTEPETQAYDASRGMILLGKGDGTFDPLWAKDSGFFFASKNIRDLVVIPAGNSGGQVIIIAANNDFLQALLFGGPVMQ